VKLNVAVPPKLMVGGVTAIDEITQNGVGVGVLVGVLIGVFEGIIVPVGVTDGVGELVGDGVVVVVGVGVAGLVTTIVPLSLQAASV
jgi:hypothetical protein